MNGNGNAVGANWIKGTELPGNQAVIRLDVVVERLKNWRMDLEEVEPLEAVRLEAGFILFDVCEMLGLDENQMIEVLGWENYNRLKAEIDG